MIEAESSLRRPVPTDRERRGDHSDRLSITVARWVADLGDDAPFIEPEVAAKDDDLLLLEQLSIELEREPGVGESALLAFDAVLAGLPPPPPAHP